MDYGGAGVVFLFATVLSGVCVGVVVDGGVVVLLVLGGGPVIHRARRRTAQTAVQECVLLVVAVTLRPIVLQNRLT